MSCIDRLPAIPLIASDPYVSIWLPADNPADADTCHWSGAVKPIRGVLTVDGKDCRFLGAGALEAAALAELSVTPTMTRLTSEFEGVALQTSFVTPALPDDLDLLSMPVTLVRFQLRATDGQTHRVSVRLQLSDRLCFEGNICPDMTGDTFAVEGQAAAWRGQRIQKPLSHSGDHVTIDWGYLYLTGEGETVQDNEGLTFAWHGAIGAEQSIRTVIAYDDIASINYFGDLCKPWYRRGGKQITDAIRLCIREFDALLARCAALDERVLYDANRAGGASGAGLAAAAWRQTLAAHKLIATPGGEMAFLSKENDSNGCIGTVDVSYPSIPLMLRYAPELVNALCRPVLEFASMPVWDADFAPHDIGRYPYATGQAYAARQRVAEGETHPPYYLYPEGADAYDPRYQMPVEECGNILIMLDAAITFGAEDSLAAQYRPLLDVWVQYLVRYGEDPGEQLCTDDFAGHLAHNANLAAKAIVGVACYGRLTGDETWLEKAKQMAAGFAETVGLQGNTPLTLDHKGWSMKYNLLWDKVLGLGLLPDCFYQAEIESYLPRINRYGLPLDSRADYTKSDWICWVSAFSDDVTIREKLLAPVVSMLRETGSRVPFSDWYDTKTGRYQAFIARSVQGGVFAPLLRLKRQAGGVQ